MISLDRIILIKFTLYFHDQFYSFHCVKFLSYIMTNSYSFMQGIDQSTVEILVAGFLRDIPANKKPAPTDMIGVVNLYYNPIISWRIPVNDITDRLSTDFTTLTGPEFSIKGYKFILKLKRSRNNLYYGAWYECNGIIQQRLHSYFQSSFNTQIADKIIESFNFIITDEEFDDVQLILHDMSDPTYSCILEHIENELRSSLLLIAYGNVNVSINNIKQNIIRILSLYGEDGQERTQFIIRMRVYCHETNMEYRKLYKFDTNQVCERGAEMYWRSKYNNFKDFRLGFDDVIKDKENLTYDLYMEIIDGMDEKLGSKQEPEREDGNGEFIEASHD